MPNNGEINLQALGDVQSTHFTACLESFLFISLGSLFPGSICLCKFSFVKAGQKFSTGLLVSRVWDDAEGDRPACIVVEQDLFDLVTLCLFLCGDGLVRVGKEGKIVGGHGGEGGCMVMSANIGCDRRHMGLKSCPGIYQGNCPISPVHHFPSDACTSPSEDLLIISRTPSSS